MKYILLILLSFLETVFTVFIYSIIVTFLFKIKLNILNLSIKISNLDSFSGLLNDILYCFINYLLGDKSLLIAFFSILIYNYLLLKRIITSSHLVSCAFFLAIYMILCYFFDSSYYTDNLKNSFIIECLTIIIVSFMINRISNRIINIVDKS